MIKIHPLALAVGMAVGLSACGGGGDSEEPIGRLTLDVTAIDGYLQQAEVWLDLNQNFILDTGEPSAISGEGGRTSLDITGIPNVSSTPIVVRAIAGQTIDEDQPGETINHSYMMSAPAGQTDITPLSTLVHIEMRNDAELGIEQAAANVATDLGLSDEAEVLGDFIANEQADAAFLAGLLVDAELLPNDAEEAADPEELADDIDEARDVIASVEEGETVIIDDGQVLRVIDDEDDDNDGVNDSDDTFPNNADETTDTDGDGVGDNGDAFPNDASETTDTDGDGVGDNGDAFPNDADETTDTDGDGVGDNGDAFPNDASETTDTDGDGVGDNQDNCPLIANAEQTDSDDDGLGDSCDSPEPTVATFDTAKFDQAVWQ